MASVFTKSYRPPRSHTMSKRQTMHRYVQATLGSGDVWAAVELPARENELEWIAMNCVDFYNEVSLLYGTIIDFCTRESCPVMSAGRKFEYLWADGVKVKSPIKVPAPDYVDYLMEWIDKQLSDSSLFPVASEDPFPPKFRSRIKVIFKRMFRVYAHIYHSHFRQVVALSAEAHLNSCFKHFAAFVLTFRLVDAKDLTPLRELIQTMLGRERVNKGSGPLAERAAAGAQPARAAGKAADSASAERSHSDAQPLSADAVRLGPRAAEPPSRVASGVEPVQQANASDAQRSGRPVPRSDPRDPVAAPHSADAPDHRAQKGADQTRAVEPVDAASNGGLEALRTSPHRKNGAAAVDGAKEPSSRPSDAEEGGRGGTEEEVTPEGEGEGTGAVERDQESAGGSCCRAAPRCCTVV